MVQEFLPYLTLSKSEAGGIQHSMLTIPHDIIAVGSTIFHL